MDNRNDRPRDVFEIAIEKLVFGGAGLGRHEGKVVFVPFSAPGDRLSVRAVEQKKNFIRAKIVRILEPGKSRTTPECGLFAKCGGCQWQHIEYGFQVEAKRKILEETVCHRFPEARALLIGMRASPQSYGYRSRARIQLRGSGSGAKAGFYRFASHKIEAVDSCPLFRPVLNSALESVWRSRRAGVSDSDEEIEISCSQDDGDWASSAARPASEVNGADSDFSRSPGAGEKVLSRKAAGFSFTVSPSAFFQANDFMLEELVSVVCELMPSSSDGEALDLYSGVGLFSLPLAVRHRRVVAVESSRRACELCTGNAASAQVSNLRVLCSDVSSWMRAICSVSTPAFDTILLDPPRSGAGAEVMSSIALLAPRTIIYVSCDPNTLCRDVAVLPSRDYRIDFIEGLDFFPQTHHFETVMRLRRR